MTEKESKSPQEISAYDFTLGVISAAARIRGLDVVFKSYDPKFHSAMALAYDKLKESEGVCPNFSIIPNRIHGDSENLSISLLVLCADGVLERLNGGQMKYRHLSDVVTHSSSTSDGRDSLYYAAAGIFVDAYYYPELVAQ
jgi:hypothetical protein